MSVEFSREKMSVEFSRDPDVENAAVNLMGMSAEQVKRMRLVDVRELVKNRVEQEHALEEHGSAVEDVVLPAPQPRGGHPPRPFRNSGSWRMFVRWTVRPSTAGHRPRTLA